MPNMNSHNLKEFINIQLKIDIQPFILVFSADLFSSGVDFHYYKME